MANRNVAGLLRGYDEATGHLDETQGYPWFEATDQCPSVRRKTCLKPKVSPTRNFDWLEMPPAGTSRNEVTTSVPRIVEGQRQVEGMFCSVSRRSFLAAGTAVGASTFLGRMAGVVNIAGVDDPALKEFDINTNGISLHVTEQGDGPAVLFCHGFPDTSYTWRRQMKAVASAGYRAIAPDMRGYGRSSAPADPTLYTPLYTAGDLIGLLDALNIPSAVIVGHDWGATHAWNAALMRPDRFKAVFCLSVPYVPRGDVSVFERMRKSGHENDFYMFEQIKPEADQVWADAAVTIPGVLYWASGSAPADKRWSPMDPARSLHRPAPGPLPSWAEPEYVAHNVAEFERTGFHGALNYYRAAEPYFYLSAAWKGAKITQPSFYIAGKADGLATLYPPFEKLRAGLPGIVGNLELDNVGHWVQHEASAQVSEQLVKFLHMASPA